MTPSKTLRTAVAIISSLVAIGTSSRRRSVRLAACGFGLMALGACSDLTAPGSGRIDPARVALILPALTDARLRLTAGISDIALRQRLILDISDMEIALQRGEVEQVRHYIGTVTVVLNTYRHPSSSASADVSAFFFALDATSALVGTSAQP